MVMPHPSVEVILEDAACLWVAQLTNRAFLDLAYPFAGHLQLLAYLFQRMVMIVEQTKAQLNDLPLAQRQLSQHFADLFVKQLSIGLLYWSAIMRILNDIAQCILLLLGEGSIQ